MGIAVLFAGQGAQYSGMGRGLYETSAAARAVFAMADGICPGTSKRCFEGDAETLAKTLYTQPCVCAVNMACAGALAEAGVRADGAAGFSLGELAGLSFAGILTNEEAFSLTVKRARLTEDCAKGQDGAMAAILGLSACKVQSLCREFTKIYPANYNCPGQTVVSGGRHELDAFAGRVRAEGGKAVILAVGGAFHSPHMGNAALKMREILSGMTFSRPRIPLYANATAGLYNAGNAANLIASQMEKPVLWEKTIRQMADDGFETFIELGPGRVLSGLLKKILPAARILHAQDADEIQRLAKILREGSYA